MHLTLYSYHLMWLFNSESTLYFCLNVKDILAQKKKRDIWNLSERNGTRTQNQLFHQETLNHYAKVTKSLC